MLYIQNRDNYTLGVIENFYNDTHQKILSSGVSTYDFTVSKNQDYTEFLVEGNYVVLADDNGEGWKFTIMNKTETHESITVQCDDIGLELLNTVQDAWSSPTSKQPIEYYIKKAVKKTEWTININEISSLERTLKWEGRDTSLARLLSIATEFDNAELEFKVEFKNLRVVKQYINIFKARGINKSEVQLIYGDTVDDITKTTSITDLRTALKGVGSAKEIPEGSPEGTVEEHVDFSGIHYDDGEYFSPAGDPFLYARTANQQFNIQEKYIEDFYEYDTSDAQELLNRTITQLKKASVPLINYEVSVVTFNQSLELGDTVTIIDHDYQPELLLNARVLQINKSYTDSSLNSIILGNFIILESSIDSRLSTLQNQLQSINIKPNYTWLRYAIDDKGNGMTSIPTADTQYVAILANKKTGIPSDDPTDYAGHWQLIQGQDGSDGIPGPKGEDGRTSYTHFAYADNVSGTKDFSVDDPTGRAYMGVFSDFTKADSTNPDDYIWSLTKGEDGEQGIQGLQGPQGAKGIAGPKGADGKTQYTHIAYSNSSDGKTDFSQTPANHKYIGMYVDFIENDSNDPTKYGWSLIKGEDGLDGPQGIAGPKGADGKTSYTHIAYANGGETQMNMNKWTLSKPAKKAGAITYKDGTNYIQYKGVGNWENYNMQFIAKKGDSISVIVTWTQPAISGHFSFYGATTPQMSVPTGEVGNTGSTALKNKVFKFTFTASSDNPYFVISGGPVADGVLYPLEVSVQQDFSQSPNDHTYIGMYTDFTEADSDDVSLYNWTQIKGSDGTQGVAGKAGADGKTPYFHSAWANSADGKTGFSTTDSVNKSYLGTYTDFTQADSTDPTKYAWSLIKGKDGTNGTPGKSGADGKTPYFHIAWADSKDGKINFSLTDATNRGYLGTYTDFTQADSTDPSKYSWVELVGALSSGGRNYIKGSDVPIHITGVWHTESNGIVVPNWYVWIPTLIGTASGDWVVSFNIEGLEGHNPTSVTVGFADPKSTANNRAMGDFAVSKTGRVVAKVNLDAIDNSWTSVLIYSNSGQWGGSQNKKANISHYQIEKGNVTGDWKQAPEDTQQQIDTVNKALVQANNRINEVPHVSAQASAPTSPKKGDQWWVLDASGKATGFKVWNGSAWTDSKIQQSLLNVVSLNAVTITGSIINGSKFTNNFDFTNSEKIRFQGVTTIGDGAVNITWKLPANNQTGQSLMNASGFQSTINAPDGTVMHHSALEMGMLVMQDLVSGTGSSAKFLTGTLNAQDSYRNSTDTVAWLGGWGDWGYGRGLIHVVRNGRLVTLSGYPNHNNTTAMGNVFQLPAWAKPAAGVNISAVCYNRDVGNAIACRIFIDNDGLASINGGQSGGYVVIGASYVGKDM